VIEEREDITEIRKRMEEAQAATVPTYRVDAYGLKHIVRNVDPQNVKYDYDDEDPELHMLKQSNPNYKKEAGIKEKPKKQAVPEVDPMLVPKKSKKKKNKQEEEKAAEPKKKVKYGSEDDSDSSDLGEDAFLPKSM
jgi:hypothetical protein